MAAGLGFKTFTVGEVLSAADVNGYLMQGVLVFATTAARDAAITSPQEGQFAFTKDTNSLFYYDGATWVASGATGDIEGVTAGTGISGGGTSGTVTVTNSMATAIDAKGDLIVGTGADTFSRLAVGTNTYTLVADSGETTGLRWSAPSSGALTLVTSGTFTSAATVTIDNIFTSTYLNYKLIININSTTNGGANYCTGNFRTSGTPNTNASYNEIIYGRNEDNTAETRNTTNETSMRFGYIGNSTASFIEQNFYNPQVSVKTYYSGFSGMTGKGAATFQGAFNATTAFDGFEFSPFSGNCTGTYAVYGFQKS